jgi:histidinol-phosphate aminotransferase
VRENVLGLVPYSPGKPIEEVKRELGLEDITKMASNENVLGPSPRAVEAMRAAAESVYLYPDGSWFRLRQALAQRLAVSSESIVVGNGSDEIIHFLGLTFLNPEDEMIQADPSFVRYEAAAALNLAKCHLVPLRDFTHDLVAMREAVNDRTKLVFIASPNNPTGTLNTKAEVDAFLADLPAHVVTVFDEAYREYVEAPDYPETLDYVREDRNVIVLRTFSKAYALAGLRVGYGIAPPELIGYLNQVREPFNVSSVAQEAAIASLADDDQVKRACAMNSAGKRYLYAQFEALGLAYVPTEANFVFVDVGRDCMEVFHALMRLGVIVRAGLGMPTHVRVTIGRQEDNERFIAALKEVLHGT